MPRAARAPPWPGCWWRAARSPRTSWPGPSPSATGFPTWIWTAYELDPVAANLLGPGASRRYSAVAISFSGDRLLVAMADPADPLSIQDIAELTQREVVPAVAPEAAILAVAERLPLPVPEGGPVAVPTEEPPEAAPVPQLLREEPAPARGRAEGARGPAGRARGHPRAPGRGRGRRGGRDDARARAREPPGPAGRRRGGAIAGARRGPPPGGPGAGRGRRAGQASPGSGRGRACRAAARAVAAGGSRARPRGVARRCRPGP